MKRIIAVLLTLLMLLPVCAVAEELQFELPARTEVETVLFDIVVDPMIETLYSITADSEFVSQNFVFSASYNAPLDAIVLVVNMPYWSVNKVLGLTENLCVVLDAVGEYAMICLSPLHDMYEPFDVYTIGYGDDGEAKYLNVNGRDLSDFLRLTQD